VAEESEVPGYTASANAEDRAEPALLTGPDRYRQAAILAWVASHNLDDRNFGRTKLVKELYFLQEHVGLDLKFDFVREAAGPLDPSLYRVENLAARQSWLVVHGGRNQPATYRLGRSSGDAEKVAKAAISDRMADAESLLEFFRPFTTRRMEQWATVHQVWKEARDRGDLYARDEIVAEALAWKPNQPGFDRRSIEQVISEMVQLSFIRLDPL
jgi:hypothetical protein